MTCLVYLKNYKLVLSLAFATTEGDLEIKFNNSNNQRIIRLPRAMSARYSSDYYTAPNETVRGSTSRNSTSQIREDIESVETIRISQNNIPEGIYQPPNLSRKSPTQSEMSFHLND